MWMQACVDTRGSWRREVEGQERTIKSVILCVLVIIATMNPTVFVPRQTKPERTRL